MAAGNTASKMPTPNGHIVLDLITTSYDKAGKISRNKRFTHDDLRDMTCNGISIWLDATAYGDFLAIFEIKSLIGGRLQFLEYNRVNKDFVLKTLYLFEGEHVAIVKNLFTTEASHALATNPNSSCIFFDMVLRQVYEKKWQSYDNKASKLQSNSTLSDAEKEVKTLEILYHSRNHLPKTIASIDKSKEALVRFACDLLHGISAPAATSGGARKRDANEAGFLASDRPTSYARQNPPDGTVTSSVPPTTSAQPLDHVNGAKTSMPVQNNTSTYNTYNYAQQIQHTGQVNHNVAQAQYNTVTSQKIEELMKLCTTQGEIIISLNQVYEKTTAAMAAMRAEISDLKKDAAVAQTKQSQTNEAFGREVGRSQVMVASMGEVVCSALGKLAPSSKSAQPTIDPTAAISVVRNEVKGMQKAIDPVAAQDDHISLLIEHDEAYKA